MKEIINRFFAKMGYIPKDGFHSELAEMVKESSRRKGEMIETDSNGFRIKIAALSYFQC